MEVRASISAESFLVSAAARVPSEAGSGVGPGDGEPFAREAVMISFQCPQNRNLGFNPNNLAITRPQRVVATAYGPVFDGGLSPRGAVPRDDPWIGYHTDANFKWDQKNIELMLNGQPPWGFDNARMVLHHRNNQANGPLDEYQGTRHGAQHGLMHDPDAALIDHAIGYGTRADYDSAVWSKQRGRYWVSRALAEIERVPFR